MRLTKSALYCLMILTAGILAALSCTDNSVAINRLTNNSHLDHLYEEIRIDDIDMGVIHIYAEYPDYQWVDDEDEGSACIDDAARAAVYYLRDYKYYSDRQSLEKAMKLMEFVLYMQDDSGYFYNFIFPDHTVNKEHKNSVNRPGWWTWRALWALTEAYPVITDYDPVLAEKYMKSIRKTINSIKNYIPNERVTENISGLEIPTWLPYKYAADQASLIVMCLSNYYSIATDDTVLKYIKTLADGIRQMQVQEDSTKYYGAMLSWRNTWHAWGNLQSYSLLAAHRFTGSNLLLESALKEIDNFFEHLYKTKYLNYFEVSISDGGLSAADEKVYSQIAYGIRPMVYSSLEAFKITGEEKYAGFAANYSTWFFGNNLHNEQMYFPETGICYDGLSDNRINRNSGAESTIEALLALQEIEQNKIALSKLIGYINE